MAELDSECMLEYVSSIWERVNFLVERGHQPQQAIHEYQKISFYPNETLMSLIIKGELGNGLKCIAETARIESTIKSLEESGIIETPQGVFCVGDLSNFDH